MHDVEDLKFKINFVLESISKKMNARPTSDRKNLKMRCPYCGDSINKSSAHLQMDIKPPFVFHCYRCDEAGVLTPNTMKDFKLDESNLRMLILELNKTIGKTSGKYKKKNYFKNYKFSTEITETVKNSLEYFNKRYGFNYTEENIKHLEDFYRVVLDPVQFFNNNRIKFKLEDYPFDTSIGFISSDRTYLILRDYSGKADKKYNNYKIDLFSEEKNKIYHINTKINMLNIKTHLILTEGIFDIIGVYEHFYKQNNYDINTNYIFAASCGKSFAGTINKYFRMGFLDMDITIYSDSDVNIKFYKDIKYNSEYMKKNIITIYYNDMEKDYGIPYENIKLRKAVV